ncbi:FadD3 family acyl-CoA ligase [Streptomyces sp. ZYX-F-203]
MRAAGKWREWGTVPGLVRSAAERHAGTEAVVDGRTRITFAELGARVDRAAAACRAWGVAPGDRVAVWAPNRLEWIVAALGAVSAGGVLVPVSTRHKGAEAVDVLRRSRARLLFVTGPFLGTSYVALLRRAAGGVAGRRVERPLAGLPDLRRVVVFDEDAPSGFDTWRSFLTAGGGREPARSAGMAGEAPSDVIYTSGTTGRPKGVVVTHAQTLRAYEVWSALAGLRPGDRYLIANPFFHTFGYKAGVLACLMSGATMIPQPVFAAETTLATVAAERVTALPAPPALLQALLDHPERSSYDLSSLRIVVTGASSIPPTLVERLRGELGVETVLTAYGLSEACGLVTMGRRGDPPATVAATSGRAVPGVAVRIADATGAPSPPGTPGEILVRGFNVMRGYLDDERATARAFAPGGWLRTGDVGVLDSSGNLSVTDRLTDMYVVGGFNAYPAEIERILLGHPGVAEAAVVGVPDARLGEVGRAWVVRAPDGLLTEGELIAWARREMAGYKVPRSVRFVDALPRNATGKVAKETLRARA